MDINWVRSLSLFILCHQKTWIQANKHVGTCCPKDVTAQSTCGTWDAQGNPEPLLVFIYSKSSFALYEIQLGAMGHMLLSPAE